MQSSLKLLQHAVDDLLEALHETGCDFLYSTERMHASESAGTPLVADGKFEVSERGAQLASAALQNAGILHMWHWDGDGPSVSPILAPTQDTRSTSSHRGSSSNENAARERGFDSPGHRLRSATCRGITVSLPIPGADTQQVSFSSNLRLFRATMQLCTHTAAVLAATKQIAVVVQPAAANTAEGKQEEELVSNYQDSVYDAKTPDLQSTAIATMESAACGIEYALRLATLVSLHERLHRPDTPQQQSSERVQTAVKVLSVILVKTSIAQLTGAIGSLCGEGEARLGTEGAGKSRSSAHHGLHVSVAVQARLLRGSLALLEATAAGGKPGSILRSLAGEDGTSQRCSACSNACLDSAALEPVPLPSTPDCKKCGFTEDQWLSSSGTAQVDMKYRNIINMLLPSLVVVFAPRCITPHRMYDLVPECDVYSTTQLIYAMATGQARCGECASSSDCGWGGSSIASELLLRGCVSGLCLLRALHASTRLSGYGNEMTPGLQWTPAFDSSAVDSPHHVVNRAMSDAFRDALVMLGAAAATVAANSIAPVQPDKVQVQSQQESAPAQPSRLKLPKRRFRQRFALDATALAAAVSAAQPTHSHQLPTPSSHSMDLLESLLFIVSGFIDALRSCTQCDGAGGHSQPDCDGCHAYFQLAAQIASSGATWLAFHTLPGLQSELLKTLVLSAVAQEHDESWSRTQNILKICAHGIDDIRGEESLVCRVLTKPEAAEDTAASSKVRLALGSIESAVRSAQSTISSTVHGVMVDLPLHEHRTLRRRAVGLLASVLPVGVFLYHCKEQLLSLEGHSPNRTNTLQLAFDTVCAKLDLPPKSTDQPAPGPDTLSRVRTLLQHLVGLLQVCALGDSVKKARLHAVKLLCQLAQRPQVRQHLQGTILTILAAKACDPHPPVRYTAVEALCPLLQARVASWAASPSQRQLGKEAAADSRDEDRIAGVIARLLRVAGHPACDDAAPPHVRQAVAEAAVCFLRGGRGGGRLGAEGPERLLAKQRATHRLTSLLKQFKGSEHTQVSVLVRPLLAQLA